MSLQLKGLANMLPIFLDRSNIDAVKLFGRADRVADNNIELLMISP